MKTIERLETATFRFVGECVNHCATVTITQLARGTIKFANRT